MLTGFIRYIRSQFLYDNLFVRTPVVFDYYTEWPYTEGNMLNMEGHVTSAPPVMFQAHTPVMKPYTTAWLCSSQRAAVRQNVVRVPCKVTV